MRKRSILLVAGVSALVASLVVGPAATASPERQAAGTVVFGPDQEPTTLNRDLDRQHVVATAMSRTTSRRAGRSTTTRRSSSRTSCRAGRRSSSRSRLRRSSRTSRTQRGATASPSREPTSHEVANDHEPCQQRRQPGRVRGHQDGHVQGQDGDHRLEEGAYADWEASQRRRPCRRTPSRARTSTRCARTRSVCERAVQVRELAEG